MSKLLSRIILGFTALSAVFFTSPVFALTASDGTVYTIGHTNNSRVFNGSGQAIYCASANFSFSQFNSGSLCTSNVNASNDAGAGPLRSYDSYYTQRYVLNGSTYKFHLNCNVSSGSWLYYTFIDTIKVGVDPTINMYGSYLKVNFQNKYDNLFYDRFYRASDCAIITQAQALALPAYVPPGSCNSDTIATGGNCSCKLTSTYSSSGSAVPLVWRVGGVNVSSGITTANTTDPFSSKFNSYYIKYPSGSSYKPDLVLGTIDASSIGGARSVQAIGASTGMIYSDSRTLVSTASGNYYLFYTGDGGWSSNTLLSSANPLFTNSASNDDNTFNSFVINSSSGSFLAITANRFSVYYQATSGLSLSNVTDNYTYLGDYLANSMITLPYGQKTRRIKIVPLSSTVYVSGVSPYNTSFVQDQVCSVLDGSALQAELASRSTFSGSIASVNFCASAIDVPVVGSALSSMCNFVQPKIKSFISNFQTALDFVYLVPPSSPVFTVDVLPAYSSSGKTMSFSTQSGTYSSSGSSLLNSSTFQFVQPSGFKSTAFAVLFIVIWLVLYLIYLSVLFLCSFLLLSLGRFLMHHLPSSGGSANIWILGAYIVYFGIYIGALVAFIAFMAFILPFLSGLKSWVIFFISQMSLISGSSYSIFYGFYNILFTSLLAVSGAYFLYLAFERFAKLN